MMAAALGVVGYSIVTVVDMACDTMLPAACLLDTFLQTRPASYVIHVLAAWLLNELLVDLTCGAMLLAAQLLNEFLAALLYSRNGVDQAWLGLGRAFQCVVSVNG